MIRLFTIALMLMTAFAVPALAEEPKDPGACPEQDPDCRTKDEATYGDQDFEDGMMYAFGNETCIECSGPMEPAEPTRGPEDCENCRDLETKTEDRDAAGLAGIVVLLGMVALALLRRT